MTVLTATDTSCLINTQRHIENFLLEGANLLTNMANLAPKILATFF